MKKLSYFLIAAAAFAAAACSKGEIESPVNESGDLVIPSGIAAVIMNPVPVDVETKALSSDLKFSWAAKDKIDVFSGTEGEQMIYGIKQVDGKPTACSFKVSSFGLLDGDYCSVYPTQGAVDDPTAIPVSFNGQIQNGNGNTEHLAKYDYNFAKATIADNSGLFSFDHLVTWAWLKLSFTSACTVKSVSLSTGSNAIVSEAVINALEGTLTPTAMTNTIKVEFREPISVSAGDVVNAYITVAPMKLSNDTLTVTAECEGDGNTFSETRTSNASFQAGKYMTLSRTFGNGVAKIGDATYESLESAIVAALEANDGTPVELIKDIEYADGAAWSPIDFAGGTVVINGNGHTVKGLPGMLFNKTGSGGHRLRMSNITFDGATVSAGNYAAVIVGYADAMNELYFENVTVKNSTVSGTNYAAAFVGYAAGYSNRNDGPVFQEVTFKDCVVENNIITGAGSTGALMGHAAGSDWAVVNVEGTSVKNNTITSTGSANNKAGSLFGTAGNAGATPGPDGKITGLFVSANVSGNTVKSGTATVTTICGRQGSTGGRLVMNAGGSYDTRPYNDSDVAWASCVAGYGLTETNGVWTVAEAIIVAKIGSTEYATLDDAINAALAANDGTPVVLTSDITFAEGSEFTPVVYSGGSVVIDGDGHTVTGLPGMLFNKQGSGGHHLRVSNITFDGAKVNGTTGNEAVIVGYADSMSELYFENVTIKNSTVTGSNYAGAFVGYAAGWSMENDGPVYQHITFKDCAVENNTITGGGSTGALIGHAAGNPNAVITVDGTTVTGNTIKCTGSSTNKAGSLFGTVGNAGADSTPDLPKGLFVSASVSGNTVISGAATISTICGRQGSTGGRLVMNAGGSYDARPYSESDVAWASCAAGYGLEETDGIWSVVEMAYSAATIGNTSYETLSEAIAAVPNDGTPTTIKISDNIELATALTIANTKNVILDLNGKTVQNEASKSLSPLITVNGKLTIDDSSAVKDGVIRNTASAKYVIKTGTAASVLTLNNGTIETTTGNSNGAVYGTIGSFVMTGGKIVAAGTGVTSKNVNVSGGTIEANAGQALCAAGVITGGTFKSTGNNAVYANQSSSLEITGGEFSGVSSKPTINIYTTDVKISGATLSNGVGFASNATGMILAGGASESYLDATHAAIMDGDDVLGYAPINTGILANAKVSGKTVQLIKDVATTAYLNVTKSFTLDLNGNNITCTPAKSDAAILVKGSLSAPVELTIKGEGTVSCGDHGEGCNAIQVVNYSTVDIEGGKFSVPGDNSTIYILATAGESIVNISGGEFSSGDGKYVLNIKDDCRAYSSFNVTGGSFVGFNPADNIAEGEHTNFVAEGYGVEENAGVYTVVEMEEGSSTGVTPDLGDWK